MDFKEWKGSKKTSAKNYRWYITSCSILNRNNAEEAAENAFEAGKTEGLKRAIRLLAGVIMPNEE